MLTWTFLNWWIWKWRGDSLPPIFKTYAKYSSNPRNIIFHVRVVNISVSKDASSSRTAKIHRLPNQTQRDRSDRSRVTNRSPRGSGHPSHPSSPSCLSLPCPVPAAAYLRLFLAVRSSLSPFATFPRAINSRAYTQVAPLFCQVHTGGLPLEIANPSKRAEKYSGGNDECLSYANGSRQRARDDDGKKRPLRRRGQISALSFSNKTLRDGLREIRAGE